MQTSHVRLDEIATKRKEIAAQIARYRMEPTDAHSLAVEAVLAGREPGTGGSHERIAALQTQDAAYASAAKEIRSGIERERRLRQEEIGRTFLPKLEETGRRAALQLVALAAALEDDRTIRDSVALAGGVLPPSCRVAVPSVVCNAALAVSTMRELVKAGTLAPSDLPQSIKAAVLGR